MTEDVQKDGAPREADTILGGWIAAIIVATIAIVGLCAAAVWVLYPQVRQPSIRPPNVFAAPRLEVRPVADHAAYLEQQRALLAGAEGRLPIKDAMADIVRRGTLEPEAGR